MRILYLSRSLIPSRQANSIHVMNMCNAFSNNHNVLLLGMKSTHNNAVDIFSYYGVSNKFSLDLIKIRRKIFNFLSYFESAMKIIRYKPDVVYSRTLTLAWLSTILRFPVIFESHDPVVLFKGIRSGIFNRLMSSKKLMRIVVISKPLKDSYCKYGIDEKMILVAHDAANENNATPLKFKNKKRLQVGYIGHLYKGRGIELIASMAQRCEWADFHIAGGMENDIKYWKSRYNNINNLKFHGFLDPSKVQSFMRGCSVLLAPYQSIVEVLGGGNTVDWMSPLKIFEYMSSGVPIIASDLPSLREILIPGKTCLMCEYNNIEDWVRNLNSLKSDLLRREISESAKKVFIKSYTWDIRAQLVLDGVS
jgi:glycosyltransferase involved in cell wall biosynthesis